MVKTPEDLLSDPETKAVFYEHRFFDAVYDNNWDEIERLLGDKKVDTSLQNSQGMGNTSSFV